MWITIDRNNDRPLMRQIYSQIKHLILSGQLKPGEKLPSTRYLASDLTVSRNTVLEAYNQLIAEGYLEGNHGSGTIVAKGINAYTIPLCTQVKKDVSYKNTEHGSKIKSINFQSGVIDSSLFPLREWIKCYQRSIDNLSESAFHYHPNAGVMKLRQMISAYLLRTRGLNCQPKNIMIVSGSTQGLSLVSNLVNFQNKKVLIEDPTHPGLRKIFERSQLNLTSVPVDDHGLLTSLLRSSERIAFVYTTPSHQYPLGGILPIQRRLELINYALINN